MDALGNSSLQSTGLLEADLNSYRRQGWADTEEKPKANLGEGSFPNSEWSQGKPRLCLCLGLELQSPELGWGQVNC